MNDRTAICPSCGAEFDPRAKRSTNSLLFCTSRCFEYNRTHDGRPRPKGRTCGACGTGIDHLRPVSKACCRRCRNWMLKHPGVPIPHPDRPCVACGKPLTGKSLIAMYCDWNCKSWVQNHPGTPRRDRPSCLRCGAATASRGNRALYCSPNCYFKSDKFLATARANAKRRRASVAGAPSAPFTQSQLDERMSVFGGRCYICSDPAEAVDHVKPIAAGGAHMLSNFRPICGRCNSIKRDLWPIPAELLFISGSPTERLSVLRTIPGVPRDDKGRYAPAR